MNRKISTLAISMLVACVSVWGSGFQVVEQGASNMGTALAGAVVNANNDASAAYWNPSAAFFVESDGKIDTAGTFIIPTMDFKGNATAPDGTTPINGTHGENAGKTAFVPNFFFVRKINKNWLATLSITSPFGLETNYEDTFVGRGHGIKSNVMTVDINPSIAWQPTDWLSLSVGASANYLHAELTSVTYLTPNGMMEAPTKVTGHSWTGSFNVGATAKFLETGRIGVSYRYKLKYNVDGTGRVTMPAALGGQTVATGIKTDMDLPSSLVAGVYYRFKDEFSPFAIMFDYAWTQWNSFQELAFENAETGAPYGAGVPEKWRNTNRFSFGIHYYPTWDKDLLFRLGCAYDQNPVRSAEYRTPRIPDSNRWWASCGFRYQIDWLNFDFGYTYILFDDVDIATSHPASSGSIKGGYTGHAHVVSCQVGVRW